MAIRIWPPQVPPPPEVPSPAVGAAPDGPSSAQEPKPLRDRIIDALRQVYDPEIPVNIYDLGLIYRLELDEQTRNVTIDMTLTTPNCPEAESLPGLVRQQVEHIPEVGKAEVNIVWDPPWDKSKMTPEARLALGLD
jgi:FeS assembly SUF system protein